MGSERSEEASVESAVLCNGTKALAALAGPVHSRATTEGSAFEPQRHIANSSRPRTPNRTLAYIVGHVAIWARECTLENEL